MVTGDKGLSQDSIRLCNHCGLPWRWAVNPPQIGGEGMQPLYCFMLDENLKIQRYAIDEYTTGTNWQDKLHSYHITINGNTYYIKIRDLDIYKRGKYVSFTDDIKAASKAISLYYLEKLEKAEADCRRLAGIVNTIKEQGL